VSYHQGCRYQQEGKYQEAIRSFEEAIFKDPLFEESYFRLAIIFHQRVQKFEFTEKLYFKVLQLNPSYHPAFFNLGYLYQDQGMLDLAHQCFLSALKLAPTDLDTLICLGIVSRQQQDYQSSFYYYNQALNVDDASSTALYNLGNLYYELGDPRNAIYAYTEALKCDPAESVDVIFNLCKAYQARDSFTNRVGSE
jgi:tetratricopeptide (TPR) repeat protein